MKKSYIIILIIFSAVALVLQFDRSDQNVTPNQNVGVNSSRDVTGFAIADGNLALNFPDDFGVHPEFQTEWWYYTGNLESETSNHYGYQLTIFRRALAPTSPLDSASSWKTNQVYFAHFALSDTKENDFYYFERFSRGSLNLAGANSGPFSVWVEDWRINEIEPGIYALTATQENIIISLRLEDIKGPILQGDAGFSQKGQGLGNASHYFSQTNLNTTGTIRINDKEINVNGKSWMDHEFSTSALSPGQVGWDWFSLQLNNNTEIMLFNLRRSNGSIDDFSSGMIIFEDGTTYKLDKDEFSIMSTDIWVSPNTGAIYPSGWTISIPSQDIELSIEPWNKNQELILSFVYWEGAVKITGDFGDMEVQGNGFVELTGYYKSMEGEF